MDPDLSRWSEMRIPHSARMCATGSLGSNGGAKNRDSIQPRRELNDKGEVRPYRGCPPFPPPSPFRPLIPIPNILRRLLNDILITFADSCRRCPLWSISQSASIVRDARPTAADIRSDSYASHGESLRYSAFIGNAEMERGKKRTIPYISLSTLSYFFFRCINQCMDRDTLCNIIHRDTPCNIIPR